jgi:CheY-like chemotaxis protein
MEARVRAGNWVLLVEDDRYIREAVTELLEVEGYRVETAVDGRSGLDKLREGNRPPALILLDLMMPGMDGYEFRRIQIADPQLRQIPVVVMSADGRVDEKSSELGVEGYLRKPIDIEPVIQTVARYCVQIPS